MFSFRVKYALAKVIDFVTSASIITFIYSLLDQDLGIEIEILTILGFTFIPLLLNYLLFKFFGIQTLGEAIVGIKKIKGFKLSKIDEKIEKDSFLKPANRITYFITAIFLVAAPFCSDLFMDKFSNDVTGLTVSKLKWKPYQHPENEWKIEFPVKPDMKEKTLNLPNSTELKLSEITAQHNQLSYSIASASLPDDLMKWSPNLILKGSFKILASNIKGATTSTDKIFKYKSAPTLPYTFEQGNKFVYGRLILIKDTLYKLEVECPKSEKDLHKEKLDKFFNSFHPS